MATKKESNEQRQQSNGGNERQSGGEEKRATSPSQNSPPRKLPQKRKLTEQEKHEGWIENLRNEERTMKDSIKNSIEGGFTKYKERALQILKFQFPESENDSVKGQSRDAARFKSFSPNQYGEIKQMNWEPKSPLANKEYLKQQTTRKTELNFNDNIINMRNSHLPLEFFLPNKGKKFMKSNVRALQSKISLKFPLAALEKEKVKLKPTIKQSIIDDFEKAYKNNCNQEKQRNKNRNVSVDSFFNPLNKPPKEYTQDDPKFLDKPCRINIQNFKKEDKPLAGKLTQIGQQILMIGSQKAKFICTGNWNFKFPKQKIGGQPEEDLKSAASSVRPGKDKVTEFNPFEYSEKMKDSRNFQSQQKKKPLFPFIIENPKIQENNKILQRYYDSNIDMSKIEKTRNQLFQQAAMTQQVSLEKPRGLYEVKRSPERDLLLQTLKEKRLQRKMQRYSRIRDGAQSIFGNNPNLDYDYKN